MSELPPPCSCGHIAYWHTEIVGSRMIGVPCWHRDCECPEYSPTERGVIGLGE